MNRIRMIHRAAGPLRLSALLVAVAVIGAACTHSSPTPPGSSGHHGTGNHSSGGTGPPGPGGPFVLGSASLTGDSAGQCLPGDQCKGFTVTCPGVQQPAD